MPQFPKKGRTRVLTAALIPLLLTSCATPENKIIIPESLLMPCHSPELTGDTYADIIRLCARQKAALEECNEKIRAIKIIYEGEKKGTGQ